MITANEVPFLRFIIPMITGIIIGEYFNYNISCMYLLVGLFLATCTYQLKWKTTCSLIVTGLLFSLGYFSILTQNIRVTQDPILKLENSKINLVGIVEEFDLKDKGYYVSIQNLAYRNICDVEWIQNKARGKVFIAHNHGDTQKETAFKNGDTLAIHSSITKLNPPSNPNDFDFATFLRRNGYSYQSYVPTGNWAITKRRDNNIYTCIDAIRSYCQSSMDKYICGKEERAIASALILGNRSYLSPQITASYVETGSMHVLAVSGLHVLIVAGCLNFFLLLIFRNSMRLRTIRIGLTIVGVWMFATLTGFSPSVVRASIMFTVIAIGVLINRDHFIINSICFSAMVMLIYNPAMLFDVGFQFSYLAVFGIVLLHKRILPTIQPKHKILKFISDCCKVSIAAQLFVLPVSVYYFHTTSTLFWLSSPIVIIYAYIIIPLGLLMLLLSSISTILATLVSYPLEYLISSFYQVVRNIQSIPYSSINDIYMDGIMLTLSCILVMILTKYLIQPKSKILNTIYMCILLILGYGGLQKIETLKQRQVIVYESSKTHYMDIIIGNTIYSYYTQALSPRQEKNLTYNTRLNAGIKKHVDLTKYSNYIDENIKMENRTLFVMDKMIKLPIQNKKDSGFTIYEYTLNEEAQYVVSENIITRHQFTQINCVANNKSIIN